MLDNIYLYDDAHAPELGRGCVMEWTGVLWLTAHGWKFEDAWARLSDHPGCTDPYVRCLMVDVNDSLPDTARQRLVPFIERIMRMPEPLDHETAERLHRTFLKLVYDKYGGPIEVDRTPDLLTLWVIMLAHLRHHLLNDATPDEYVSRTDELLDLFEKAQAEEGLLGDDLPVPPSKEELDEMERQLADEIESHAFLRRYANFQGADA